MGKALAHHFEKAGISVQILGRGKEDVKGRFVIFAIPYEDMISLLYPNQDYFANKIIIDISNPLDYQTRTSLLEPDQSASLKLAELFPDMPIIKAFNTNFSSSRVTAAEEPPVLLAGNHPSAKEQFIQLLGRTHFKVIDLGSLDYSRDLEAFARVQLALLESGNTKALQDFAL